MIRFIILSISLFLTACASNYTSLAKVRQSTPQQVLIVPLAFDDAYHNLLSSVNECFVLNVYKIYSHKQSDQGEIAVMAANFPSGTNIWLTILLVPKQNDMTEASVYWGNSNWQSHAEKVKGWAQGSPVDC